MTVHVAGISGQTDTKIISSKLDTNTETTYDEYLKEISQDLEKCEERGPPFNENIAKLFQNLVYNDITLKYLKIFYRKYWNLRYGDK